MIDPIWRVIDTEVYNRAWATLVQEAELYGFVGFDMEWTTKLEGIEAEEKGGAMTGSRPSLPLLCGESLDVGLDLLL